MTFESSNILVIHHTRVIVCFFFSGSSSSHYMHVCEWRQTLGGNCRPWRKKHSDDMGHLLWVALGSFHVKVFLSINPSSWSYPLTWSLFQYSCANTLWLPLWWGGLCNGVFKRHKTSGYPWSWRSSSEYGDHIYFEFFVDIMVWDIFLYVLNRPLF